MRAQNTGSRPNADTEAGLNTANGFATSNATSNYFLGGTQRSWMNQRGAADAIHATNLGRLASRVVPNPASPIPSSTNGLPSTSERIAQKHTLDANTNSASAEQNLLFHDPHSLSHWPHKRPRMQGGINASHRTEYGLAHTPECQPHVQTHAPNCPPTQSLDAETCDISEQISPEEPRSHVPQSSSVQAAATSNLNETEEPVKTVNLPLYDKEHTQILEASFLVNPKPDNIWKRTLAKQTNSTFEGVHVSQHRVICLQQLLKWK